MPRLKPVIFISHIHEDAGLANALQAFIAEAFLGFFEIFVSSDGASIRSGDNWSDAIEAALEKSELVLVLLSHEAAERRWIYFESGGAYFSRKRVIPICCRGMAPADVMPPLAWLQSIDASSAVDLSRLISDIATFFELRVPGLSVKELVHRLAAPALPNVLPDVKLTKHPQPVFVIVDRSGSMAGQAIEHLRAALIQLCDHLRGRGELGESRLLSIVTFGSGAELLVPLSPPSQVTIPQFSAEGGSDLGAALRIVASQIENSSVMPKLARIPIIAILTDGTPTDDWQAATAEFKKVRRGATARVVISIGSDIEPGVPKALANAGATRISAPLKLHELANVFRWLASSRVIEAPTGALSLEPAAPPPLVLHQTA